MAMTVWRLTTHHKRPEALLAWAKESGQIAIGWNSVGDLAQYEDAVEIKQAVRGTGHRNWPSSGRQLIAFRSEMQTGDLVVLSTRRLRAAVMRVDGDYVFAGDGLRDAVEYAHRRSATVVPIDAEAVWNAAGGAAEG